MLVLARKLNETICIGSDVRVTVLQIRNGRIRLGIEAPSRVRVRREEAAPSAEMPPEIEFEMAAGAELASGW